MHRNFDVAKVMQPFTRHVVTETMVWSPAVLLLVDLIVGGPQGIVPGTPIRHFLYALALVALAFGAIRHRSLRVNPYGWPVLLIAGFLFLNILWATAVPLVNGGSLRLAFEDADAFLMLLLVPLALLQRNNVRRTVNVMQHVIVYLALVVAVAQIVVWLLVALGFESKWSMMVAVKEFFGETSEARGIYVGESEGNLFRVFWISSIWHLIGFFWVRAVFRSSTTRWAAYGIFAFAIYVSYTRGLWFALVIAICAVLLVRFYKVRKLSLLKDDDSLAMIVVALAFVAAVIFMQTIRDRVRAVVSWDAEQVTEINDAQFSVQERIRQAPYLINKWRQQPVIGTGYGGYVQQYVRNAREPYSYENIPLMMLMKLGIIGLVWFGAFFIAVAVSAVRRGVPYAVDNAHFVGALVALLLVSATNPYLINFVGMAVLSALLLQWTSLMNRQRDIAVNATDTSRIRRSRFGG